MTVCKQTRSLGYEGIRSFCRFPLCFEIDNLDADVAIIGSALDTGTTNRCGARYGPQAIREGSMIYSLGLTENEDLFDVETQKFMLKGLRVVDCGDIPTPPTLMNECFDLITDAIKTIASRRIIPVILGGDHSVSFPVVRGLKGKSFHVIQFDAHLDLMDNVFGMKYTHGNPMKRILEMDHVTGMTQIGIRGLLNGDDWETACKEAKTTVITADEVHEKGEEWVAANIPEVENLYITLDIDVFDPKEAPGTGTPEFGGLYYRQMVCLLRKILAKGNLVGMDIVEVNPLFDPTGRTGQLAARLILDIIGSAKFDFSTKT